MEGLKMSLLPAQHDLTIMKGDDFSQSFQLTDNNDVGTDLTGYTFKSEIRENENQTSTLIETFSIDDTDKATGIIVLSLTDAETLAVTNNEGFYSILYTSGAGIDTTYIVGKVDFDQRTTVK